MKPNAKPFSVRSLVGMTMGARRRAARYACVGQRFRKRIKLVWFKGWCKDYHGRVATIDDIKTDGRYQELRAKYRIGERLQPCPGKHGCLNCTRTCGACEDQMPDDTKCARCGSVMTTAGPFCDGSGVVNAGQGSQRKAWANGRPRIVLSPWLSLDNYSAMRVLIGTDPTIIANRRAFIEKTPQIFDGKDWIQGPKGSGGAPPFDRNEEYGFYPPSRQWCDEKLIAMGYVLTEEVADAR